MQNVLIPAIVSQDALYVLLHLVFITLLRDQVSSFFDYKTIKLFCNTGWQTRCNVL